MTDRPLARKRLEAALEVFNLGWHDSLDPWADTSAFKTARAALSFLLDPEPTAEMNLAARNSYMSEIGLYPAEMDFSVRFHSPFKAAIATLTQDETP